MKLNREYLAIEYYKNPVFRRNATEEMFLKNYKHVGNFVNEDDPRFEIIMENFSGVAHDYENHKFFYVSNSVVQHSQLIKFDFGKMNIEWLFNLKSQNSTYIISKDEFYIFKLIKDESLRVWHFKSNENGTINIEQIYFNNFFNKVTKQNSPSIDSVINYQKNRELNEKFFKLFLFINLSEPVIEVIKDRQKKELKDNNNYFNKIKNETGVNVHLVSTLWNKIIIHDSEFKVRGHFRIQPCGKGRTQYKIIWIDSFVKSGYIRGLEKLKETDRKIGVT